MIRTIIWFIWFAISLIISIPLMFRVKYLIKKNRIEESKALIYKCTNLWANSLLKVAGVKVNVHGLENIPKDKAVLFVGNHQGNFDIPIYITQIPLVIGFISKIEVEKIPLVRTWMNFMHCVFMDRSNLRKSGEAIIKGIKNLKSGHSIVIFPEGTRSKGGPADILLIPETKDQIKKSICICKENNIPVYVIGNGSNILVRDGGFRGVVISLKAVNNITVNDDKIEAECGAMLKAVSDKAMENSLTGFEFACGIPGTIGGAVFMNAGAYDGEVSQVIESVEVIDENCNIIKLTNEELDFGYRSSLVMKKGYTVLSAVFKLKKGTVKTIKELVDDLTNKRESKQPLEYPSAGSTFKRPTGYFAGKLIQDAGLKGYSIGGAAVSEKHSGFVINKGNATAKDITDLIEHIQDEVMKQFGVELHTEVRIIGEE